MTAKHNPGPWCIRQDTTWPWTYRIYDSVDAPVIDAGLYTYSSGDTMEKANARSGNEATHANARLISAAPEMLEALRMSVAAFEGDKLDEIEDGYGLATAQRIAAARAAIAKAEGEQA